MIKDGEGGENRFDVKKLDDYSQFNSLKELWEELFVNDRNAYFYSSWFWLQGWFSIAPKHWYILGVWDNKNSQYVGFLPLSIRKAKWLKLNPVTVLQTGTQPLSYINGILCNEDYEMEVINALSRHIQSKLHWDEFVLKGLMDKRSELFVSKFLSYDIL